MIDDWTLNYIVHGLLSWVLASCSIYLVCLQFEKILKADWLRNDCCVNLVTVWKLPYALHICGLVQGFQTMFNRVLIWLDDELSQLVQEFVQFWGMQWNAHFYFTNHNLELIFFFTSFRCQNAIIAILWFLNSVNFKVLVVCSLWMPGTDVQRQSCPKMTFFKTYLLADILYQAAFE